MLRNRRLYWLLALVLIGGLVELGAYGVVRQRSGKRWFGLFGRSLGVPEPIPYTASALSTDDQVRAPRSHRPVSLSTGQPQIADLRAAVKGANLVICVLDAARADHFGCYGYPRATTPNFDRLAREALVFEHHFCQYPHTTPSTASLLTSQYPDTHGMVGAPKRGSPLMPIMDPAAFTIEKGLARARFQTLLFSSNVYAAPELGIGADFGSTFAHDKPQS